MNARMLVFAIPKIASGVWCRQLRPCSCSRFVKSLPMTSLRHREQKKIVQILRGEATSAEYRSIQGYQHKCKDGRLLPLFAKDGNNVVVNTEAAAELLEGESRGQ